MKEYFIFTKITKREDEINISDFDEPVDYRPSRPKLGSGRKSQDYRYGQG